MKNLFAILFLLIPFSMQGQEIKFMGLEFGTNIDVFCNALKAKGLKQTVDRFETKEFVGTFATYNDCRIIITATEKSNKVKSAEVIFESVRDNEYERNKAFKEILKQYHNKYGNKVVLLSSIEEIGYKVYGIDNGDIVIHICSSGPSFLSPEECSMSIYYFSKELSKENEVNQNKYSNDI